jgi:hypothetical protein
VPEHRADPLGQAVERRVGRVGAGDVVAPVENAAAAVELAERPTRFAT